MAPEKAVVLLDERVSPFGQRVRITLAEKGVEHEYQEEDLANKSPLLLKSNPVYKKIPVLIHDGKPICESLIIVQYIDEVWVRGSPLLPSNPYERANARFWADFVDKKIYDSGARMLKSTGQAHEEAKEEFIENLKLLEGELRDKTYFGGENFGLVDIAFVPFTTWFYTFEVYGNFSIEKECPKLVAWGKRCMERESVSKSLQDPHVVYELLAYLLEKKYGKVRKDKLCRSQG